MKNVLRGWTILRILRFAFGLIIVGQAILSKEWTMVIPGCFLAIMAIANTGCCAFGSCTIPSSGRNPGLREENRLGRK
jgi:hypothetical protein